MVALYFGQIRTRFLGVVDFLPLHLLLFRRHRAEIIIVKRFI